MTTSSRTATCVCAQLALTLVGDPAMVMLCHCEACQKRTGSSHAVVALFSDEQLESRTGEFKVYERVGELGTQIQFEFCGECGTTVSWTMDAAPGTRAIAMGCFADPQMPAPVGEFFTKRRHHWMPALPGVPQSETQPGSPGDGD